MQFSNVLIFLPVFLSFTQRKIRSFKNVQLLKLDIKTLLWRFKFRCNLHKFVCKGLNENYKFRLRSLWLEHAQIIAVNVRQIWADFQPLEGG